MRMRASRAKVCGLQDTRTRAAPAFGEVAGLRFGPGTRGIEHHGVEGREFGRAMGRRKRSRASTVTASAQARRGLPRAQGRDRGRPLPPHAPAPSARRTRRCRRREQVGARLALPRASATRPPSVSSPARGLQEAAGRERDVGGPCDQRRAAFDDHAPWYGQPGEVEPIFGQRLRRGARDLAGAADSTSRPTGGCDLDVEGLVGPRGRSRWPARRAARPQAPA